ncbi:MAG: hypothetical protein ACR2J5_18470 [Geodermatophilaceae bacterium]
MSEGDELLRGRESFQDRAWSEAYDQFQAADEGSSLEPQDLERLASAAYLTGRDMMDALTACAAGTPEAHEGGD